jgi:2-(1,2-epoxy-1,2-dihydrophenyl)acetyl-CoA isomerase
MSSSFTTIETAAAGGVLTITLNRPDVFNAFNEAMSVELSAALRNAQRDDAVRCIVLTGAGKAFCSGQDLSEVRARYKTGAAPPELDFGAHLRQKFNPIVSRLRTIEKPVIAAVNGAAAGAGASFALACDLRICARSAYFLMAFVHVGLIPDSGATLTLLQHAGYCRAAELCLLGEKLPAEEALRYNLVNRVVDAEQLTDATRELAARLAALPTRAIGMTKRALSQAWTNDLEGQLEYEAFLQQSAGHTTDHREGVLAFLEKRKPTFHGR